MYSQKEDGDWMPEDEETEVNRGKSKAEGSCCHSRTILKLHVATAFTDALLRCGFDFQD